MAFRTFHRTEPGASSSKACLFASCAILRSNSSRRSSARRVPRHSMELCGEVTRSGRPQCSQVVLMTELTSLGDSQFRVALLKSLRWRVRLVRIFIHHEVTSSPRLMLSHPLMIYSAISVTTILESENTAPIRFVSRLSGVDNLSYLQCPHLLVTFVPR